MRSTSPHARHRVSRTSPPTSRSRRQRPPATVPCLPSPSFARHRLAPASAILIYGAAGAIGSAAVQLASHMGADITAFAGVRNLDLVRSLGAREAFDYATNDPAEMGRRFDMILDAVGKPSFLRMRRAMAPHRRLRLLRWPPELRDGAADSPIQRPSRHLRGPRLLAAQRRLPRRADGRRRVPAGHRPRLLRSTRWSRHPATSRRSARPATSS